jgi:GDP-4-dehydro-6-deoxy-D-mannose reductase
MRTLVTGANGFVGRWLTRHLRAEGDDIWEASRRQAGPAAPQKLALDVRIAEDTDRTVRSIRPDAIYHLAAVAFGPDATVDPAAALETNVVGTINVLKAAANISPAPTVMIVSSSEVYGAQPAGRPIGEDIGLIPVTAYGATKAAQEMAAAAYARANKLPVVVVRPFNHIGPGQRVEFAVASFVSQLVKIGHGVQEPKLHVGNLAARRDFTDVRDVVIAYRLLVAGQPFGGPVNVASGRSVSIGEILDRLIALSGLRVEIVTDPLRLRSDDVDDVVGDSTRLRRLTDWSPRLSLETSLSDIWHDAIRGSQS